MIEPVTFGMSVASALSAGALAVTKGILVGAGSDAYKALKAAAARWAAPDVELLEKDP